MRILTTKLLELADITKEFGRVRALDGISFQLQSDDFTALIGPNGAGKTTLYNIISGRLEPTSGWITFKGENITEESTVERVKRGIGRSFQISNIFDDLTVFQNIRAPLIAQSKERFNPLGRVNKKGSFNKKTEEMLEILGLSEVSNQKCSNLSYGNQRRVEIGIALVTNPELVLLDEPTAGLNPNETAQFVELIHQLNEETESTFFITEHNINMIFSVATHILVLDQGTLIAQGSPEEIRDDKNVRAAYLGEEV